MRIVFFVEPSPFTYVSGVGGRFKNTVAQLAQLGAECMVVTTGRGVSYPGTDFEAGREPPAEFCGARVLGAYSFGCPVYATLPMAPALQPGVFAAVRAFRPDVVHCTSPGVMCFAAILCSRLLRKPLVLSYHTHAPAYMPLYGLGRLVSLCWAFIRAVHAFAAVSVTVSDRMALALERGGLPRPTVWAMGVDCEAFHPRRRCAAMRRRLMGGADARVLVLYVGRVAAEKNVAALGRIMDAVPGARLAVVGDGPARRQLESELRPGGRTVFTGWLHGSQLGAAYASADIFLTPSETETLGFTVLEAMASELPVVAPFAGGIPDIITAPGKNGFLYRPSDHAAAAAELVLLARDASLRSSVGRAARERVLPHDWQTATRLLLKDVYERAAAENRKKH